MALFDWDESFSVKVSKFDNQHKKLIALINDLHAATKQGKSKDVMEKILEELVSYTKIHFADEEKVLSAKGYSDFAAHKNEHDRLTNEVMAFYDDFKAGRKSIGIEVLNFLNLWLRNHILGADKKYSALLQGQTII